jgi:AbrB family looped-hinge helix DNA binding protein
MTRLVTRVSEGGRVVIPAEYRKALGLNPGDEVVLLLEEGGIRILTPREAARRAQALVRSHIPAGRKLADELIAERRQEARDE